VTRAASIFPRWGLVAANGLRLSGWLAVNALVALGLLAAITGALGGFSLRGTILQLANLAAHFETAPPARQHDFGVLIAALWSAGFAGTGFFRRASLLRALEQGSHAR